MHGGCASCLLDVVSYCRDEVTYIHHEEINVCVCVFKNCVCTMNAQDTTCAHKTLLGTDCSLQQDLPCPAAAAEEPTSKLTGSESVYNREGQMPWAKSW